MDAPRTPSTGGYTTTLIGRRAEIESLSRLVRESRCVVVVGPFGVGKTRLARTAGELVVDSFPDGVLTIDLHGAQTADDVCKVLAHGAGIRDSNVDPLEAIIASFQRRRILVVLDNCDAVDAGGQGALQSLLSAAAEMTLVTVSQLTIHIPGAHVFAVSPLILPPAETPAAADHGAVLSSEAAQLFVDRARLVRPDFEVTDTNAELVSTLCHHLDGLPLAIEMAASWARVLTIAEIAERVRDHPFLLGNNPAFSPTHRSFDALMSQTYALLTEPERFVWSRVSVFEDSFDLMAIESVCSPPHDPATLLDALYALVDKSLLAVDHSEGASRFRLLRIARNFALSHLDDRSQVEELHRQHYARSVDHLWDVWLSARQLALMRTLALDSANIVRAIERGLARPDTATDSIRMATALWPFWFASGRMTVGREIMEQVVASPATENDRSGRAALLQLSAYLCVLANDSVAASRSLQQANALFDPPEGSLAQARGLYIDALLRLGAGEFSFAADLMQQVIEVAGQSPETEARLLGLDATGLAVLAAALSGQSQLADQIGRNGVAVCAEHGDRIWRSYIEYGLAVDAWLRGEADRAREVAAEAMRASVDELLVTHCIELLAWCAAREGDFERSGELLGAAGRRWTYLGGPYSGVRALAIHHDECARQTRRALGDVAFDAASRAGETETAESVYAHAMSPRSSQSGVQLWEKPSTGRDQFTVRETEVAGLVAKGMSNREISESLWISTRTVETHVERILKKSGLRNRTRLASWWFSTSSDGGVS